MALDKVIDSAQLDANLTAVADAIRTKGGTSEAMSFPDGFVSAVEGIQAGGGGVSEQEVIDKMVAGTWPSGDIVITKEVYTSSFTGNTKITSVTLDIDNQNNFKRPSFFDGCTGIKSALFKKVKFYGANNAFNSCTGLEKVICPRDSICGTLDTRMFNNCTSLTFFEGGTSFGTLNNGSFYGCKALKTLVLRKQGVVSNTNPNVFTGTPFASGGTGGTVYCPAALIEQYQQATNWSTLFAAGTCNFVAIEGSEYE